MHHCIFAAYMVPTLATRHLIYLAPVFLPQGPHPTVLAASWVFQSSGLGSTVSPQNPGSFQRTTVPRGHGLDRQMFIAPEVPLLLAPTSSNHAGNCVCICSAKSDWGCPHKLCVLKACSPTGDTMAKWLELEGDSRTGGFIH